MTCFSFQLVRKFHHEFTVFIDVVCLFVNRDSLLIKIDSVPTQTDDLTSAQSVVGSDQHHYLHSISSENRKQPFKLFGIIKCRFILVELRAVCLFRFVAG